MTLLQEAIRHVLILFCLIDQHRLWQPVPTQSPTTAVRYERVSGCQHRHAPDRRGRTAALPQADSVAALEHFCRHGGHDFQLGERCVLAIRSAILIYLTLSLLNFSQLPTAKVSMCPRQMDILSLKRPSRTKSSWTCVSCCTRSTGEASCVAPAPTATSAMPANTDLEHRFVSRFNTVDISCGFHFQAGCVGRVPGL